MGDLNGFLDEVFAERTQRNRLPKGSDGGGQFAASTNPEATVDLGGALTSPYEGYEGPTVGELRAQLASLPDDEPAFYWFRNRGYDGDRNLTPEQWRAVADRFLAEIDRDSPMFEPLAESFTEVVDEIAPYDEAFAESFSRQMNRDDFADLFEPILHPDRGSDDSLDVCYGGTFKTWGTDLEFVRSQPSDHVWSSVIDELGGEVLVNGIREIALGYYITRQPFSDEYDVTVTR